MIGKKSPKIKKEAKAVGKLIIAKQYSSKLIFKALNNYIKPPLILQIAAKNLLYLGENVNNLLKQKVARNVANFWAISSFQKVIFGIQK